MGVHFKENEEKITLWMIIVAIFVIGVLTASLIVYFINMNQNVKEEHVIGEVKQEEKDDDFEAVSIEMGKTVNEVQNELNVTTNALVENENTTENIIDSNLTSTNNAVTSTNSNIEKRNATNETNTTDTSNISKEVNVPIQDKDEKEVKFVAPVKGSVIREFAFDSLVYSNTLEEWITHNGVDIAANKATVVKSAASGTVFAIKNDPRYGLTVIVNHENGYQTLYANLLTAEYVVEGENIEAGQTIGTIGNSATFEIADEHHLHFELLKDGEFLNPTNYIEF